MLDFLRSLFDSTFMPHGHCYQWLPEILWLHVASDAVIALAYYSIPIALFYFARRRLDLKYRWMFVLFAAFILLCGTTHLMEIWAVWNGTYRLTGLIKAATGFTSIATAMLLWPVIPEALRIPSTTQLEHINAQLKREIEERKKAEAAMRQAQATLEQRVAERTSALQQANEQLQREIDERKRAQQELKRHAEELERSNKELERFAYVASHDLQEPLRKVINFTQLLARRYEGQLDEKADTFIAFIVDGATRMQDLINDLLTLSRVGTRGQAFAPTNLETVLDTALSNLKISIEEAGAEITRDALPTLTADSTQLVQLFQNLLGNAIKFRRDIPPSIHVGAEHREDTWHFRVQDNGIGLEPEYAERIFVIFQRLHNRSEYPGTGIGLAICKKIVERHGGQIWVESQPGAGSTFYFTIPANQ